MKPALSALAVALALAFVAPDVARAQDMMQDPNTIPMQGNLFLPAEKTVAVGTTLTWINLDPEAHNVLAFDGSFLSDLEMPTGAIFAYTFNAPGTFAYVCDLHVNMAGVVNVV